MPVHENIKGLSDAREEFDGRGIKVVILHTRWNQSIISALVAGAIDTLLASGVTRENILIENVPGSYELPWAASQILSGPQSHQLSALIAIGTLIKGETVHFEYISEAVSHGLMKVSLDTGKPVIFGVLTCLTELQAQQRAGLIPGSHNHGVDWAKAAVECAVKKSRWTDENLPSVVADKQDGSKK